MEGQGQGAERQVSPLSPDNRYFAKWFFGALATILAVFVGTMLIVLLVPGFAL